MFVGVWVRACNVVLGSVERMTECTGICTGICVLRQAMNTVLYSMSCHALLLTLCRWLGPAPLASTSASVFGSASNDSSCAGYVFVGVDIGNSVVY